MLIPDMEFLRPIALACAFSAGLPAQNLFAAGNVLRTASASYTRGPAGFDAGELMQRFDASDLTGFGVEAAYPNWHVVRGVLVHMRDFGSSTPNGLVDITLYTEDASRPGYPDLGAPLGGRSGIQPPMSVLTYANVPFAAPVLVPPGRDLFVGVRIPATTSNFGGVRLAVITSGTTGSYRDLAGPGLPSSPPEENSYRLYRDLATDTVTFGARGQYQIDLLTTAPGGFPAAITNQSYYPISLIAPGTTTMLSGLHPDAASPALNPGRADDVAFFYSDYALSVGSPVLFVAAFADFGPTVPLELHAPGSVGGLCLDQSALFVLGFAPLNMAQECWFTTVIPAAVRPMLRGVSWTQQAIGLDVGSGALRGTQCGKQHF